MKELRQQYLEILRDHLAHPGEEHLFRGYNFGKSCAEQGVAMSEVVALHFEILGAGGLLTDENLPDSQELLLEVTLAMSVSGGMKTMEHVLAALYDESVRQFKELREAKEQIKGYSERLEEKVHEKLQELQAAEERFETLVETIPDVVYKIDRQGRFVYLNKAVCSLGYEAKELLGRHFREIILPDDLEQVCASFVLPGYAGKNTGQEGAPKLFDERRSGERKTSGLEVRLLLKSGKVAYGVLEPLDRRVLFAEVSSSGLHVINSQTEKRELIGTVGVIRDITERKQIEIKLRRYQFQLEELVAERTAELSSANQALQVEIDERKRSEDFVRGILQSMEEGLVVLDRDYGIITANRAYAELVGRPVAEIIGRHCYEVSHHVDRPCHQAGEKCPVTLTFLDGKPYSVVHEHPNGAGSARLVETKSYPMRNSEGDVVSVIEIVNDITEKRELERQLRQAQKMEAIGTLAGGIAHDFNNILTAIMGYEELAAAELPDGSRVKQDLQESLNACLRAKELVRQILGFSRQTEHELRPLLLTSVVKEGLKMLRASLPSTIEIRQDVEAGAGMVLADPTQIHQVLMNLCTNALHAMADKGGVLEIRLREIEVDPELTTRIRGVHPGPYVLLSVRDTGVGMPREVLDRIFDPYFTTKPKGKGTGLGLAVVHAIVQEHGGSITVESRPGNGSTFKIYLPVLPAMAGEDGDAEGKVEEAAISGHGRILLLDDEPAILHLEQRMLERLGYTVEGRRDGVAALELICEQGQEFDLVITDMTMPKMTGVELARRILEMRPDLPVILCTGFHENISQERAKELGISAFLMKPLRWREFGEVIQQVLEKKRAKADSRSAPLKL